MLSTEVEISNWEKFEDKAWRNRAIDAYCLHKQLPNNDRLTRKIKL